MSYKDKLYTAMAKQSVSQAETDAYLFEFQGMDTFLFIWFASVLMLTSQSSLTMILFLLLRHHKYSPVFQFGKICV
jgi:hypothetical protein